MGAVWLCTDRTLGRQVAVKQVGGLPGESTPHLARALREARSAAALNHPNVVSIYDAIEDGGHVWLVMEYLPSRNLSELLKDGGAIDPRRAAHLGAQVADGLAAAHRRGTVHRDVKPSNILVTDDDHAKISDFGIARTIGDEQLTQTGLVSGTPLYFSPSLARGQGATPADDVWALGATLYAAVEGRPPWPSQENSIAMLMHIANHEPPVPDQAGPLATIIRAMMSVDPDARPSMAQAAATLHAVATGTTDDTPTAIFAAPVAATATTPLTQAAAAPPTPPPTPLADPAPPIDPPPPTGERRRRGGALALVAAALVLVLAVGAALLTGWLDDDEQTGTATDEPTSQQSRTRKASPTPTPTPEETEAAEPTDEPEEETEDAEITEDAEPTQAPPAVSRGNEQQLVRDYYGLLPSDIDGGWSLLAPELQDQVGYDSYRGFWSTIESVQVRGVRPEGGGTVLVDLLYNGSEQETRRITVRDGLLVADGVA